MLSTRKLATQDVWKPCHWLCFLFFVLKGDALSFFAGQLFEQLIDRNEKNSLQTGKISEILFPIMCMMVVIPLGEGRF